MTQKPNFTENKFQYFESLSFCNINFETQFNNDCRRIKVCSFKICFFLFIFIFSCFFCKQLKIDGFLVMYKTKNGFWKATAVSKVYEASSTVRQVQKYIRSFLMRRDISRSLRFQDIFHDSRDYGRRTGQEITQENAISSPIPSCGTSRLHQWP